ncbi:hypothetical protein HK096_001463, partial [Nowakowskiella sp. JEL0078]
PITHTITIPIIDDEHMPIPIPTNDIYPLPPSFQDEHVIETQLPFESNTINSSVDNISIHSPSSPPTTPLSLLNEPGTLSPHATIRPQPPTTSSDSLSTPTKTSGRIITKPSRYSTHLAYQHHALLSMTKQLEDEPINICQALSCSDATQWKDATIKEIQALENLNSWT